MIWVCIIILPAVEGCTCRWYQSCIPLLDLFYCEIWRYWSSIRFLWNYKRKLLRKYIVKHPIDVWRWCTSTDTFTGIKITSYTLYYHWAFTILIQNHHFLKYYSFLESVPPLLPCTTMEVIWKQCLIVLHKSTFVQLKIYFTFFRNAKKYVKSIKLQIKFTGQPCFCLINENLSCICLTVTVKTMHDPSYHAYENIEILPFNRVISKHLFFSFS